jgi:uncharacterized phage protein (TIGR02220 family)
MNKVEDGTYIVIQSFMVNELDLTHNELIIYAIIYGFSQGNQGCFNGSQQYLGNWAKLSRQSVINNLKSLQNKGLIDKREVNVGNQKFIEYRAIRPNFTGCQKTLQGVSKNFTGGVKKFDRGCQKTLHNNNNYTYKDINKYNNNTLSSSSTFAEIVDYLNSKTSKNYRASTRKTKSLINARMNEGFTVDDFKKVIDNKTAEWLDTKMEQYLRPETLFGTKFESYLNQNVSIDTSKNVDTDYYNSDEYMKLVEQSNLELEKEMESWGLD